MRPLFKMLLFIFDDVGVQWDPLVLHGQGIDCFKPKVILIGSLITVKY